MDCREFREFSTGDCKNLLTKTRAERATAAIHWRDCTDCRVWLDAQPDEPDDLSDEEIDALADVDSDDPEVQEMLEGKQDA
jgi:hypothetical protein